MQITSYLCLGSSFANAARFCHIFREMKDLTSVVLSVVNAALGESAALGILAGVPMRPGLPEPKWRGPRKSLLLCWAASATTAAEAA